MTRTPSRPRPALTPARLARALRALRGRRVAVVGDVMLDEFLWGDANRISPEAPVPVVLLERSTWSLGGAANVAANVAALGGRPRLYAATGDDADGAHLRRLLAEAGIEIGSLPAIAGRCTTVKHRIFARNKHMLRFDQEATAALPVAAGRELLAALQRDLGGVDAVVISDYAKGCITPPLARGIAAACARRHIPWCVDPKATTIRYPGATVLKPNIHELEALSGLPARDAESLRRAARKVLRSHGCQHVLVTRGQHGMALFGVDGTEAWLDGGGQQVADVTGAGDTVSATVALGLAAKLPLAEVAQLANRAAAHVVSLPGTSVVRPENLLS